MALLDRSNASASHVLYAVGFLAIALSWLLPGHYPPWSTYQQQWLCAFGAALVTAAGLLGASLGMLRWPWLALMIGATAAIPLLQVLCGQLRFYSDGLIPALYLIAFALCMASGTMLTRDGRSIEALLVTIVIAATVSTAIALVQWLGISHNSLVADLPPGGRPFGNLGQPNHLATLLGMAVAAVFGSYEQRRLGGLGASALLTWLGMGLVMTQSRTGWLFVAVLTVWWFSMRQRAGLRTRPVAIATGVVLFVLGVAAWEPLSNALLLGSASMEERLDAGTRWMHWVALWDAIKQQPWLGYGWLQVPLAQQSVALVHLAPREMLQDSHNVVLDLMVWTGIPLGGLLAGAVTIWLVIQVWRCRDASHWALLAAIIAVLIHSLLEYPLDYTYFLLPLGLMMGAVDGATDAAPVRHWHRVTFVLPLAAMAMMLFWVGIECMQLENSARRIRFFMAGIRNDGIATVAPANVKLLDAPREYLRFWVTPARANMDPAQLDWMRDVSKRNAFSPAMLRFALAAGLNGRPEEAKLTLALLCQIHNPKRCEEANRSWKWLQEQHQVLREINIARQR